MTSSEKGSVGVTYSLTCPGSFPALLAGCGLQQATRLRGTTCTVLWDRMTNTRSGMGSRAVLHHIVPTRVLETAVAPFIDVALPLVGVCPIPRTTQDSPPTHAQVFSQPIEPDRCMVLPRVVVLPRQALCAVFAGAVAMDSAGSPPWCSDASVERTPDPCDLTATDPWRQLSTTAVFRTTSREKYTTVTVAADDIASALEDASAAAPFLDKLDLESTASQVTGELRLTDATVARLGFVTAVECGSVSLALLRALLFQLNNDRRFSGVAADGSVTSTRRKVTGTQIEKLSAFSPKGPMPAAWKSDDFSSITKLHCFGDPQAMIYVLRSARLSIRDFHTGFGNCLARLLAAAREAGFLSDAVGPGNVMVESLGDLLPALTSIALTECSVERGFFASLANRKLSKLKVGEWSVDAEGFRAFCQHPAKPTELCTELSISLADDVSAVLPFFPLLRDLSCTTATAEGLALVAQHCPMLTNISVIHVPKGLSAAGVAAVAEIVSRPTLRNVNIVGGPFTTDVIRALRSSRAADRRLSCLRFLQVAACKEHAQRVKPRHAAMEAHFRWIKYDLHRCRLDVPDAVVALISSVGEAPLSILDSESQLTGSIEFIAAHALPTHHLPPPQTIARVLRTDTRHDDASTRDTLAAPLVSDCEGQAGGQEPVSLLTDISPPMWGGIDLPTSLPFAMHAATGRLSLLNVVALGGPASVLLAVADHCPLLEDISWALPGDSGQDPFLMWSFGHTPPPEGQVPVDLLDAAEWVRTAALSHRPSCFQTLTTLYLDFGTEDDGSHGRRISSRSANAEARRTMYAAACVLFATACPVLGGVTLTKSSLTSADFDAIPALMALVDVARACDFSAS